MQDYEFYTCDDCHFGRVVDTADGLVVIQHGTLHKVRHAVPRKFVEVSEDERVVRTTLSKRMIEDSPKFKPDDAGLVREIAAYYGLASGYSHPETEGYGQLDPDDPALSSEQQTLRDGGTPASQERLEARKRLREGSTDRSAGRPVITNDPTKHR